MQPRGVLARAPPRSCSRGRQIIGGGIGGLRRPTDGDLISPHPPCRPCKITGQATRQQQPPISCQPLNRGPATSKDSAAAVDESGSAAACHRSPSPRRSMGRRALLAWPPASVTTATAAILCGSWPCGGGATAAPPSLPADMPPATSGRSPKLTDERSAGVAVRDIVEGKGRAAAPKDFVVLHYTGRLAETGEVFDDTLARNKPRAFVLGGPPFSSISRGLMDGIQAMKPGGTREIVIPPDLGFGPKGAVLELPGCTGPLCDPNQPGEVRVPGNSTLVYQVRLLKVTVPPPGAR